MRSASTNNFYLKCFVLIIIIASNLFSCTQEISRGSIKYIPDDLRAMFSFGKNSYWIYQDSISGKLDTLDCENVRSDTVANLNDGKTVLAYEYRRIFFPMWSKTLMEIKIQTSEADYSNSSLLKINSVRWVTAKDGYNDSDPDPQTILLHPFIAGNEFIDPNPFIDSLGNSLSDTCKIRAVLNQFQLNTLSFNNVVITDISHHKTFSGKRFRYFFAEGVGLIQYKNFNDNTNYKLIDYHLE